ncbi:MAG: AMP-binding protein [Shewanella sp.]|nr:AMP-binding protein [Shewanella sp.]
MSQSIPYDLHKEFTLPPYSSLAELIETTCLTFRDKIAFSCLGQEMSFYEVDTYSRAFSAYIQHKTDLKPGDRIGIQLPNLLQFVIAAFGAIRAGLILVNTNPLYTERESVHQFQDSGAKALVTLINHAEETLSWIDKTDIQWICVTEVTDMLNIKTVTEHESSLVYQKCQFFNNVLIEGETLDFTQVQSRSDALVALQYTGGTTGLSKGAMLTHSNLLANMMQVKSRIGRVMSIGEDIFVAPLPIYHIYAFLVNLVLYFESGCHSVLIPNPRDINRLVDTITHYPLTGFAGLNTLFVGLCHQTEFKNADFSKLKLTISGGTALTQAAADLWHSTTGCTASEGYGLSETSPVVALNAPGLERIGTIGKIVLGTKIKIINADGFEVPIGETGELAVSGPQVMKGYWNNEYETQQAFTTDGYFKTGDIALRSSDGYLTIVDRKKDMILVSGFNVYPNEVENILASHSAILECAVIGIPDSHSDESVKAVIVLVQDIAIEESQLKQEIIAHCKKQLTSYKVPRMIEFVESLPKSTVGKILRRELR